MRKEGRKGMMKKEKIEERRKKYDGKEYMRMKNQQ